MKPSTTWKSVELKIARYLGGERRGADFVERDGSSTGKDDVTGLPGWAVEIKHDKQAGLWLAKDALAQVDTVYGVVQGVAVPVAIIHRGGLRIIEQSVACFTKTTWDSLGVDNCFYSTYSHTMPRWSNVVNRVTQLPISYQFTVVTVSKIGDSTPPIYAVSLPNFKKFILPLRLNQ